MGNGARRSRGATLQQPKGRRSLYFERVSRRNPQEIRAAAPGVLSRHGLTLYNIRDLCETYLSHGNLLPGQILILEIGDEGLGMEILPSFPQAALTVPYRILVYSLDGITRISTFMPEVYREVLPLPREMLDQADDISRRFKKRITAAILDLCR